MHLVDQIKAKARTSLQTVVLPESYDDRMIQAAEVIVGDSLAKVVLLGDPATLEAKAGELGVSLQASKSSIRRMPPAWKIMSPKW